MKLREIETTQVRDERAGMKLSEVAEMLGCCGRTILRMIEQGKFPKPSFYVGNRARWRREVVTSWMAQEVT